MSCDCTLPCGNETSGLPILPGAPTSTACQRATIIGSIPEVWSLPWFTLSGCTVASSRHSEGGIENVANFFKSRRGCYYDKDGQLSGSTCA